MHSNRVAKFSNIFIPRSKPAIRVCPDRPSHVHSLVGCLRLQGGVPGGSGLRAAEGCYGTEGGGESNVHVTEQR